MPIFALMDPDGGGLTELDPTRAVTVPRQRVLTAEDAAALGAEVGDVVEVAISIAPGALLTFDDALLDRFLIVRGEDVDPPLGQRVTARGVALVEGALMRTFTHEDLSGAEVAALRAVKLSAVADEAVRRIAAVASERAQRRLFARGFQLLFTEGADPAAWPPEAQAELQAAFATWSAVQAIEAAEAALVAALTAETDPAALAAFDVAGAAEWP